VYFGSFAKVFMLTNLLAIPATTVLVVVAMSVLLVIMLFPGVDWSLPASVVDFLCNFLERLVELLC
ncbi:MAG: ComEC/Rec2 family competence protein, partial [Bacteroidales bacterium]|nr:ComEC/Rec2 family competence protein [Bacteroidales bacterium]